MGVMAGAVAAAVGANAEDVDVRRLQITCAWPWPDRPLPGQLVPMGRGGTQMPHIHGGMQIPPFQGGQQRTRKPNFLNIYKRFSNWNICFLCGFDIEDGHTSGTCPFKKANHQTSFTRKSAQQFIVAGYDPCTKGMHKTLLPTGRNT